MNKLYSYFPYFVLFSVIIIDFIIFYALMKVVNVVDKELTSAIIGFIGAILGGLLTLVGVKMTLDKQSDNELTEKERHKNLLFAQLKYTYNMFSNLPSKGNFGVEFIIYDKNWNERLYHINELDEHEYKDIVAWFHVLSQIELMAQRNSGYISFQEIDVLLINNSPKIQRLLYKYGYI